MLQSPVGGTTEHRCVAAMIIKHFEALLNSPQINNIDAFLNQNLKKQEKLKDFTNLVCTGDKLESHIHKLPINHVVCKNEIVLSTSTMLTSVGV